MKKENNRNGRRTLQRSLHAFPRSLREKTERVSLLAYLITIPVLSAISVFSCSVVELRKEETPEEEVAEEKSTAEIDICNLCAWGGSAGSADIFIYSSEGTRPLLNHLHTEKFPVTIPMEEKTGTVVVIANSKAKFNDTALSRMDSMQMLQYSFAQDNPLSPLLSGTAEISSSQKTTVELLPLMCRVILKDVSNNLPGYALLENPRIFLSEMNPSCEVLRREGFRPEQSMASPAKTNLGCDVGFYTKTYCTSLYCYPNDTPEDILGSQRTCFNLECEILGKTVLFPTTIPPAKRNSTVELSLTVESDSEYRYDFSLKD